MAQVTIPQLPQAQPLSGTESVPISQNGQTVQTTVAAIANSPTQQQTFLTVNQETTLPNSRRVSGGTGVGITDGGPQGVFQIALNGASGSLEGSTNGLIAKTSGSTVVGRSITSTGNGITVSNADGVAGNPVLGLNGAVGDLNGLSGTGLVYINSGNAGLLQVVGTPDEITVTDGTGPGNPTVGLADNPVLPGVESVLLPKGTTFERPGAVVNGEMRYNTTTDRFEGYQGGQWKDVGTDEIAQDLAGGSANQVVYQVGPNDTSFIVAPTVSGTFLRWNGSAFEWGAIAGAGTVTSVNASGGTTGMTFSGGPITASGTLTMSGTLIVANGGTGATSLTGYVKGNGASAMTASATIPSTDITGLGSMSAQNASSVAVTGGNIDGTTIGGTTPAAGTFTSVAMTTGTISAAPVSGNDIVNRTYADSIASGINFHQAVRYATTAALPACTYANGISGVGATLTGNANGALTVDGYTFTSPADNGTRILVKNQASQLEDGVYTLTQAGNTVPGAPFILTRATDFDTAGSGVDQIDAGDFFLVTAGTANANTSWVQQTPLPITVGVTAIVFAQFGAPITYSAGTGLNESPSYTFNIATTGVTAATYGSASAVPVIGVNAQGQITTASNTTIAIDANQITSGTVDSARISGSYTGITAVGTLTTGTWNATTISVAYGGTGLTSYAAGDLIYGNGATTLSKLTLGTSGQVLVAGATAPQYVDQSTLSVGSATNATNATNAINATNVSTTATATNANFFVPFVAASTTGNQALGVDAGLSYNPSTNALTAGVSGGTF